MTKQWSGTKDDSTHHGDSESDVTSQSSEPNFDVDISSPDEHVSSPDIPDIYTGLDSLTDADKDGSTMTHTQESSDEEHWDESDEDYEEDQHTDHNPLLSRLQPSTEFQEHFSSMYPLASVSDVQNKGAQTISTTHWVQMTSLDLTVVKWCIDLAYFKLPTNSHRYILSSDKQHYLKQMYTHLYPQLRESDFSIPLSIRKYSSVTGPLFRYDSNGKGSNVLANWADQAH